MTFQTLAPAPRPLESLIIGRGDDQRHVLLRQGTSDTALVGQIFIDGAFRLSALPRQAELLDWLKACRSTNRRPLVIDAGANIGLTALAFSFQIPEALVVALEPEPENFELLVANTEELPILPLPMALGGGIGRARIEDPDRGEWGYQANLHGGKSDGTEVPVISVDTVCENLADHALPFIVKIDIEGAETEVFSAGGDWIYQVPLVIVELHDWMLPGQRTSHAVLHRLLESDRDFVILGENLFCLLNQLPHPAPSEGAAGRSSEAS